MLELERLTDLYDSDSAELAVVYGRRRLGKTKLVKQSLSDREDAVFFTRNHRTGATVPVSTRCSVEAASNDPSKKPVPSATTSVCSISILSSARF